jgi:hypothetical protein
MLLIPIFILLRILIKIFIVFFIEVYNFILQAIYLLLRSTQIAYHTTILDSIAYTIDQ